jgi:hypothetical protein
VQEFEEFKKGTENLAQITSEEQAMIIKERLDAEADSNRLKDDILVL